MGLAKALLINTVTKTPVPVLFNPPEYTIQRNNQFAEIGIPGLGSTILQFVRGESPTMNVELFFDTTDSGDDVRAFTDLVLGLLTQDPQTHAPAVLLFQWGSLVFKCVIQGVQQRFDLFNTVGKPLRARLTLNLKGFDVLEELLASRPLFSPDFHKRHVARPGDTLSRIAARELDNPGHWRAIAEASGIDDPLKLSAGQILRVPKLA